MLKCPRSLVLPLMRFRIIGILMGTFETSGTVTASAVLRAVVVEENLEKVTFEGCKVASVDLQHPKKQEIGELKTG